MNQRPTGLSATKAITGFLQYKSAEGLAPVTVSGYERDLKLWIEYQGDVNVSKVQSANILASLNYLRTDYVPRRITGKNSRKLAPKTVYNIYVSLASFFTWASREFNLDNPLKNIPLLNTKYTKITKACPARAEGKTARKISTFPHFLYLVSFVFRLFPVNYWRALLPKSGSSSSQNPVYEGVA